MEPWYRQTTVNSESYVILEKTAFVFKMCMQEFFCREKTVILSNIQWLPGHKKKKSPSTLSFQYSHFRTYFYSVHFSLAKGFFLSTPRIKIKREGETDSEEKRFTKNRVRGNGRGRELDASREHTLTENIAPWTAAGVWLTSAGSFFAGAEWISLLFRAPPSVGIDSHQLAYRETKEVTEGHSHPSRRGSASLTFIYLLLINIYWATL